MSLWSFISGKRKRRILKFEVLENAYVASLETGSTVAASWDRVPGLENASQTQRRNWKFNRKQTSIIWPQLGVEHDAESLINYALRSK
jgi:hypothetical protein